MKNTKITLLAAVLILAMFSANACANIIVYTTKWCPYCTKLEKYLDDRGVKYQKADVDSDPALMQDAIDKSGQNGIPVLDWNGEVIVGFGPKEAKEINRLAAGGAPHIKSKIFTGTNLFFAVIAICIAAGVYINKRTNSAAKPISNPQNSSKPKENIPPKQDPFESELTKIHYALRH